MKQNIHYVNNSGCNIDFVFSVFQEAYKTGKLNEDFEDMFSIEILKAYNPDGTDRMIINAA
jgi:hypothetical protein